MFRDTHGPPPPTFNIAGETFHFPLATGRIDDRHWGQVEIHAPMITRSEVHRLLDAVKQSYREAAPPSTVEYGGRRYGIAGLFVKIRGTRHDDVHNVDICAVVTSSNPIELGAGEDPALNPSQSVVPNRDPG